MEGQGLSIILIVWSHVFSLSCGMGFPGRRRPFDVVSLSNALFSGRPLASQVNSKHFNLKSFFSLQELPPASTSNARLITWLTEWQSCDSGLFVTENCLRRFKERLVGSRVRAARICKVLLGGEIASWVFWKCQLSEMGMIKGQITVIWPVSDSWHSSRSQPQGCCSGEEHCVAVCLSLWAFGVRMACFYLHIGQILTRLFK